MYKQSNVTSKLLDEMIKTAEQAKQKDYRSDFLNQITPILEKKTKTFQEIMNGVLNKRAQFEDPAYSPAGPTDEEMMGEEGIPTGDLVGDEGEGPVEGIEEETEETEEDPASLVQQALDLLQRAQSQLSPEPEMEEPLDEPMDEPLEGPVEEPLSDGVGVEEPLPETGPPPRF